MATGIPQSETKGQKSADRPPYREVRLAGRSRAAWADAGRDRHDGRVRRPGQPLGEREARGLGVPYPPTRERLGRLEETLAIAHQMWRGDTSAFTGQFYQLDEPLNVPQPLARPHPPILIGGEGERQTLRMVAQYGDACNFQLGTPLPGYPQWYIDAYHQRAERLPHKLACVREHCRATGRSYDAIERTVLGSVRLGPGAMSTDEVVEVCHELAEMGFQHVIYNLPDVHTITPILRLAEEVIPRVQAL